MSLRAVVFDFDGVLADSNPLHFRAFRALCEAEGFAGGEEVLHASFGLHNRDIMPRLAGRALSDEESARLADRKESLYRALALEHLRPVDGAVALVEHLASRGVALAVGSSGPGVNVALGLRVLGLAGHFPVVVSGDDAPRAKPHPDIFLRCARDLGVEPSACVVVEDAPAGVQAARAAGMRVLAVTTSCGAEKLSAADRVVASLRDVDAETLRAL